MKRKTKYFLLISSIVAIILGLIILIDVISVLKDYPDNSKEYSISSDSLHWRFKSVGNYVLIATIQFVLSLSYILMASIAYMRNSSTGLKLLVLFFFVGAVWVVRYIALWAISGFDHYPGFDPYIL